MNQTIQLTQTKWTQEQLNEIIIDAIQDIKGSGIVLLDLRHLEEAPTDYFIICEGESNTQVSAISSNITRRLKEELMLPPNHVEGTTNSTWICLDYFNTVVHVFYTKTRAFYELEDLWGDAKLTSFETL